MLKFNFSSSGLYLKFFILFLYKIILKSIIVKPYEQKTALVPAHKSKNKGKQIRFEQELSLSLSF